MIFDKQNLFTSKQAVAATTAAPDVVDLGKGDIGPSNNASLVVCADGYSGTGSINVELKTSDTVDGAGALTGPVTIAIYGVDNATLLKGGRVVAACLPYNMKRYCGVNFVVSGTATGGTLTAGLVLDA